MAAEQGRAVSSSEGRCDHLVSDEPLQQAIQAGHSICLTEAGLQRLK
jgi:hypothetical protein